MCYFFVGIFFVPSVLKIIPQALLMGHTFYATTFIVSMFRFRELKLETFLSCPFFYSQFFILLASLLIGIFDFRIGVPLGLLRGITSFASLELLELAFLLRFMDLLVPHFFYALFFLLDIELKP